MNAPASTRAGLGFLAGVLSFLTFHQGVVLILWLIGLTPRPPYPINPVPPFGVPQVVSYAFWSGLYGLAYGLLLPQLPRQAPRWLLGLGLGVCAALVAWFVVAPIKGQPMAGGWVPLRMLISLLIHGAWGIGVALILDVLLRRGRTTIAA